MEINGKSLFDMTIVEMRACQFLGGPSAREILDAYQGRIASFDQDGVALNALVTLNPEAVRTADELDELRRQGASKGPLHGVPVLIKDNLETADLPTSFGSEVFADYRPRRDATTVAALRAAGAVVVGKTTMPDWASAWFAQSSRSGVTKNPYAPDREPGGSSSGTAAAVAAGFAAIGLGTDTGGSVRLPASFCNLVGARSTPGLISRAGCSPLVTMQDTIGPLGRSVADVALVFDLLVGYDGRDPMTAAYAAARAPESYAAGLGPGGLRGRRLGVLRSAFGPEGPDTTPVNEVMEQALQQLTAGGAELVDVELPLLEEWSGRTSFYHLISRYDLNTWMKNLDSPPAVSLDEIYETRRFNQRLLLLDAIAEGSMDPDKDLAYHQARSARELFMKAVVSAMQEAGVAALIYPTSQALPPFPDDTSGENWSTTRYLLPLIISSQTWLPAISVPAGFSDDGLPVGLEILVRPYDEPTMFQLAHGFEEVAPHRRWPVSTPI